MDAVFELAIQTESIGFELEDVRELLVLFWENFESEQDILDPATPGSIKFFLTRIQPLGTLFTAILNALGKAEEELRATTENAYSHVQQKGQDKAKGDKDLEKLIILYNAANTEKREMILGFASGG